MRGRERFEDLARRLALAQQRICELEGELDEHDRRDAVTGLCTLSQFGSRLDVEIERSRRHGRSLSVAMLDVDGFRTLNAHHGRACGDRLLAAVGRVLTSYTRTSDLACRASADEFAVLFPEADGDEAGKCLERVLLELEATEVGPIACVSASAGIATYQRPQSSEQLLAEAGRAMDRARAEGGARAVLLDGESSRSLAEDATQRDAVSGLAVALLERDRYTGEHSESVVEMAVNVARSLGADPQDTERIGAAALLHDIGKVAIPDEVLHKPAPLDPRELHLMREHPVIGERILRAIPGLGGVARIVRHEHESWDGSGYPDGLMGEEIPLGSRIILACDAYHAMTSDRPYRRAMSHAEAIRELSRCAGNQFDPQVTQQLIGFLYGRRQASAAVAI